MERPADRFREVDPDGADARSGEPGTYGYMNWFLNTGRKPLPSAPESSVTFRGNGANIIYIDWDNDLVVVVRWIRSGPALNEFIGKVLAALKTTPTASSSGRADASPAT